MLGNSHFYNRTIRKLVVAFGTIFNDLSIIRYNKAGTIEYEKLRVPLSYGPKEKFITRLTSDPTLTKSIATALPRLSFDLQGISYDSTRKFNSLQKTFSPGTTAGTINSHYSPVPYNFDFSLSLYARNIEDGMQILEQILPFFKPDFTVSVKLNSTMTQKYDIPVILNNVSSQIDYEGDMLSTRMLIWDLQFTVKAFIFPQISTSNNYIRQANTNIYIDTQKKDAQKVYVDYANGNGVFTTAETIRVPTRGVTGKVTYFSNNAIGTLIVEELNELLVEGDMIVGDYSNAHYEVNTIDLAPVKAVSIVTTPNPINSDADDNYGFSESFSYWPETLT
jgi:FlaG/FlaF family flagellin (archaellin)